MSDDPPEQTGPPPDPEVVSEAPLGLAEKMQRVLTSGWHGATVKLLSQFPVIGPHGTDLNEGELLLNGKKPLGWIWTVPENVDPFIPENQKRIAMERQLDEAVADGRLKAVDVVVHRKGPDGSVQDDVCRHYCQPGLERDLDIVSAANEKIWNGQEPDVPFEKSYGDYLGYRKRDQALFDGLQKYKPYVPKAVVNGIYKFNELYTQPAYLEQALGHPVGPAMTIQQGAQAGDPEQQWKLGMRYEQGFDGIEKDGAKALQWYSRAADQGLAVAQYRMGYAYTAGTIAPQNYAEAGAYYHDAAEQGYPPAMTALGLHLEQGLGVKQDVEMAGEYFHKAAELGDGGALLALGRRSATGQGVAQDNVDAAFWYKLAAQKRYTSPQGAETIAALDADQTATVDQRVADWQATHAAPRDIPVPASNGERKPVMGMVGGAPPPSVEAELKKAYQRLKGHAQHFQENVRIAMDTPSALVTSNSMVQKWRLNKALGDIAETPEGAELVRVAKETKLPINTNPDPLYRGGGLWTDQRVEGDRTAATPMHLAVQGFATEGRYVSIMAHELQHLRQAQAGVIDSFQGKLSSPEETIFYKRFVEADAEATATEIAWQLKEKGKPAAWNSLRGEFSMTNDISAAYEKAATGDPASLTDGRAKRAAFDAWFTAKTPAGVPLLDVYNPYGLAAYPASEVTLEQMRNNGAKLEPMTADDLKKVGSVSKVNYLDLPGGRPLDDPYYRNLELTPNGAENISNLKLHFNKAAGRVENTVTLEHGTSEANLQSILEGGFEPRYRGAREKVRGVVEGALPEGADVEAKVTEVLDRSSFVRHRAHEIGDLVYTTSDPATATGYAVREAQSGGEMVSQIYNALGQHRSDTPNADARPVRLTIEAPDGDVVKTGGETYRKLDTGEMTIDSSHEVLLKATGNVTVKSVTFARRENGQWTFDGQPSMTPEQALKEIQPKYASPREAAPVDAGQRAILKEINDFATGPDVTVTMHDATYVAQTKVKNANGFDQLVRVPDPGFAPMAEEKLGRYFTDVAAHYKVPYDLTPVELNAYLTTLDVREQHGQLPPEEKAAKMTSLLGEMERLNPELKDVSFDRANPAQVATAVHGVLNDVAPADIQFHLSAAPRPPEYEARRGPTAGLDWDFAPATLDRINSQMDVMNANMARKLDGQDASRARVQQAEADLDAHLQREAATPPLPEQPGVRGANYWTESAGANITLEHGTSEGALQKILTEGFQPFSKDLRGNTRTILQDMLPGTTVSDELVTSVLGDSGHSGYRTDQTERSVLFGTLGPESETARNYAIVNAQNGGEFASQIHGAASRQLGHAPPRYAGARPVLVTFDIPRDDLGNRAPDMNGFQTLTSDGLDVSFARNQEIEIKNTQGIKVNSVTFAAKDAEGNWTFAGQPAVSPEQALGMIQPKFAGEVTPPVPVEKAPEIKVAAATIEPAPEAGKSKFMGGQNATAGAQSTPEVRNAGVGGAGAGAIGLVMSAQGLEQAYRSGDKVEMGIAGVNLATSTAQTAEGVLTAAGKTLPAIEGMGKFIPGVNIAVTAADGLYQISREDTHEHMAERATAVAATATTGIVLGTAAATTTEAAVITAGVTGVLGTGALATGTAAVAIAAAPVVLTVAAVSTVAYAGEKAIEAKRAWDDVDKSIAEESKPQKRDGYRAEDGKPSILQYKHIAPEMLRVSADMRDENMNGKPARDKTGRILIDALHTMDMHDPKNIAELERALDLNIKRQQDVMRANDSVMPRWMWGSNALDKYTMAQMELGDLTAAKTEIGMYKKDLAATDAAPVAMAAAPATVRRPAPGAKPGG